MASVIANNQNGIRNEELSHFAGSKISKIRILDDHSGGVKFVTGSWDNQSSNLFILWQRVGNKFIKASLLNVGKANITDIFTVNSNQFISSLSDGSVKIVDCTENGTLTEVETFEVHRRAASTSLCAIGNHIFSGSDNGTIVQITLNEGGSYMNKTFGSELMGVSCLRSCGLNQFISGHLTGQLHLWDVRTTTASSSLLCQPLVSRAVTNFNNSITSIDSHPGQPNLLAFGTDDGSVSFIDIRRGDEALPIVFKISKSPINEIKFHPIFANNCFSLSEDSVIHWDASAASDELNNAEAIENGSLGNVSNGTEQGYKSVWLSDRAWNNIQLRALVEGHPPFISSFDIVNNIMVIGSNTCSIICCDNLSFTN